MGGGGGVRLTDSNVVDRLCDELKTKEIKRSRWRVEVDGCVWA
jgi:hypothetical protein